jgi:hypothetical protein
MEIMLADPSGATTFGKVSRAEDATRDMVRIVCANGASLKCSETAMLRCADGEFYLAIDLMNRPVATRIYGELMFSKVVRVQRIGKGRVRVLSIGKKGDGVFWAGEQEGLFLAHHNKKADACVADGSYGEQGRLIEQTRELALIGQGLRTIDIRRGCEQPGVRITTAHGIVLRASERAPILTRRGLVPAYALRGERALVKAHGRQGFDTVVKVDFIGNIHSLHLHAKVSP